MSDLLLATPAGVRACLSAALKKAPQQRFLALRARPEWQGPPLVRLHQREFPVVPCASPLALREALVAHADAEGLVVLLTDRLESELGRDVLARLVKRRLHELNRWEIVRALFEARSVDRRLLTQEEWVARALIEAAPDGGYPPAPTGVLDLDTAWRHLLARRFGFVRPDPTLEEVLVWAQERGRSQALREEAPEGLEALRVRLVHTAGPAAAAILAAVVAGAGERVVALGLACRVAAHPDRATDPVLREAFVRLERFQGDHVTSVPEATAWADAAEAHLRGELAASRARARPWLAEAEAVLGELKAGERAHLSDLLRAGLDQRLEAWGAALGRALAARPVAVDAALEAAAARVGQHALATDAEGPAVDMALRLARWLAERERPGGDGEGGPPRSLPAAVERYAAEGAFVDWARARIWDQGQAAPLRAAYARLLERVEALRAAEDQAFGALLADWAAVAPSDDRPLPVERVLAAVVAPLAQEVPTLLVVLDGMSQAVFRELEHDLYQQGWIRLRPSRAAEGRATEGGAAAQAQAIAAFPTITEVSRASLLCGRLTTGTQQVEQASFPAHPALLEVSKASKPPLLFHKDGLSARGSGLADAVHAALADPARRVVGVVINAVDDHLMKGDQVPVRWTVEQARPLDAILTAARQAGRAVVFTADHGHVVDRGTTYVAHAEANERFRPGDGAPPTEQEVRLAGPRVSDRFGGAVVAPWSDRVRYSAGKRHGYHGGASPAEVVVPLAVFTGSPLTVTGWEESPLLQPTWWSATEPEPALAAPRPPKRPAPRPVEDPGPLFAAVRLPEAAPTPDPPAAAPEPGAPDRAHAWIEALLASDTFQAQHARAGRSAPPVDRVRAALTALEERGGTLTQDALGKKLGLPAIRVSTTLAVLRRVLNVEGYPVLAVQEGSVVFNRDLAAVQFGLEA